jgi:hypothetical protein
MSEALHQGRDRRKNDTMTTRSHKRRIPFATIFPVAAAVLPSRASGQDMASADLPDDWIDEAERRTLIWFEARRRHKSSGD